MVTPLLTRVTASHTTHTNIPNIHIYHDYVTRVTGYHRYGGLTIRYLWMERWGVNHNTQCVSIIRGMVTMVTERATGIVTMVTERTIDTGTMVTERTTDRG